ncbi:MAG: DNA translocase FtsK 4TM domain-containing protein [Melioribacteraceae bacterium]|nr:DNA translocase FtsK 4TM domain-containing protein [Melioribacteraceae bacterium]
MSKNKNPKNTLEKPNISGESYFIISPEKKKKILALFLFTFAIMLFLSILSYSRADESNLSEGISDVFKVFSNNTDNLETAGSINNWLGIFGALISKFFILGTIGYFSLIFPILLFIWGYSLLRNDNYKISIYLSNFLLVLGLVFSSIFGMMASPSGFNFQSLPAELSGKVGSFIGTGLGRLLGGLGSLILLLVIFAVALIIAFDIKFSGIYNYILSLLEKKEKEEQFKEEETYTEEARETITPPAVLKQSKSKLMELLEEDEPIKETPIKIIRKEEMLRQNEEVSKELLKSKKPLIKKDEDELPLEEGTDFKKELASDQPDQWNEKIDYKTPTFDLLIEPEVEEVKVKDTELKRNAQLLKDKLKLFDIDIDDITVTPGPVVTLYEIVPAPGVKISRIVSLEHDIALALAARGIRIIAPIPGKSAIGVEIPNAKAATVRAKSVVQKLSEYGYELPLAFGKTISGEEFVTDLAKMPHLLIAGSTGSGKSVGINMIITSLLYAKHPSEVKFVIIDPKKIELSFYKKLSKHFLAVSPDLEEEIITTPSNSLLALKAVEYEMEKRYDKLAKVGVRDLVEYNKRVTNPKTKPKDTDEMKHYKLPYIIVIIDELADLMITSGKEVEEPIARLAQLARAVGIHLIVATQRPSVNVITGVIKANFNARMAYQVATRIDSRTILDMNGAEQLLGRGDMLFLPAGTPKPFRIQNAFISTEEVERITDFIYIQKGFSKRYFLPSLYDKRKEAAGNFLSDLDPMFEEAARVIVRQQQGSVSLLQRKLKLGYSRAARIVDQLEEAGIVGPSDGSKAREVIVDNEEKLESILRSI